LAEPDHASQLAVIRLGGDAQMLLDGSAIQLRHVAFCLFVGSSTPSVFHVVIEDFEHSEEVVLKRVPVHCMVQIQAKSFFMRRSLCTAPLVWLIASARAGLF
jgi:hypothetical protein